MTGERKIRLEWKGRGRLEGNPQNENLNGNLKIKKKIIYLVGWLCNRSECQRFPKTPSVE